MTREERIEALALERFGDQSAHPPQPTHSARQAAGEIPAPVEYDDELTMARRRRILTRSLGGFHVPHRGNGRGKGVA